MAIKNRWMLSEDVVISLFVPWSEGHDTAMQMMQEIIESPVDICISASSIDMAYRILIDEGETIDNEIVKNAQKMISKLSGAIEVIGVPKQSVEHALAHPEMDFSDALEEYAAATSECSRLITNGVIYRDSPLNRVAPQDVLEEFKDGVAPTFV